MTQPYLPPQEHNTLLRLAEMITDPQAFKEGLQAFGQARDESLQAMANAVEARKQHEQFKQEALVEQQRLKGLAEDLEAKRIDHNKAKDLADNAKAEANGVLSQVREQQKALEADKAAFEAKKQEHLDYITRATNFKY